MSSTTVYLVTGSNRGLGLGFVQRLAERPNTIVFAGARDIESATELKTLAAAKKDVVHLVKFVAGDAKGNEDAVAAIKSIAGQLDVVIANAGINNYMGSVTDTPVEALREHFDVNTIGLLVLFQAVYPLLKLSSNPKFVYISSGVGSIEGNAQYPFGFAAYGISKVGGNYLTRKIHGDYKDLVAFPLHPGLVDTDMAALTMKNDSRAADFLKASVMLTVEASVRGMLDVVDKATRETHGGKFLGFDGEETPW